MAARPDSLKTGRLIYGLASITSLLRSGDSVTPTLKFFNLLFPDSVGWTGQGIVPEQCYVEEGGRFGGANVRFGSLAEICSAKGHVRFAPNSDRKSEFPQKAVSALPPKADIDQRLGIVR